MKMKLKLKEIKEYPSDFKTEYIFEVNGKTAKAIQKLEIEETEENINFNIVFQFVGFNDDELKEVEPIFKKEIEIEKRLFKETFKKGDSQ